MSRPPFPARLLPALPALAILAATLPPALRAADADPAAATRPRPALTATPQENPGAERNFKSTVLMDLLDPRGDLRGRGVTLSLTSVGDAQGAATDGGFSQHRREGYFVRNSASLDVNLERLTGGAWTGGSFHASGVLQTGERLAANDLGLYQNVSSVAGHNTFRLNEVWFEQAVRLPDGQRFSLRLGQLAAHDEFALQDMHSSFVANAFGNPQTKTNLRTPSTPAGQPGVRLRWEPTERVYLKAGVYNGNSNRFPVVDKSGVSFRFKDDAIVAGEIGYRYNVAPNAPGLAGDYKAGLIHDFGRFARYHGGRGDYGNDLVYVMATQEVYRPDPGAAVERRRGLSLAAGAYFTPNEQVNVAPAEFVGLARYTGLFAARPHDTTALAVSEVEFSARFRDAQRRAGSGRGGSETLLEVNHEFIFGPVVSLQPNVQVIVHPYGDAGRGPVVVLGLRHLLTF